MYQLSDNPDQIIRTTDYAFIPRGHRWWTEYEEWLAAGNEPLPAAETTTPGLMQTVLGYFKPKDSAS